LAVSRGKTVAPNKCSGKVKPRL